MIVRQCKCCGKMMTFRVQVDVRTYCSRACFLQHRGTNRVIEDDENVVMPPLEHICDQGFLNLTTAIINQAKDDIMHSAPGTPMREDAEAFFLSETFYGMTNLDGFDTLCKIQDKYDEMMRRKAERKAHARRV